MTTDAPHRLLEGHPPRRAAAHHHAARPRARVLRRHPAALLRHPDGPPVGHRHHRHPRRRARSPRSTTTTASSCSAQINTRLDLPQPLTVDDVIAERSGVRPLVVKRGGGDQTRRRLDVAEPQARDRARRRPRRRHRLRRQAHRLPQRRRGGRRARSRQLGVPLEKDLHNWYGEPAKATRTEFYRQARLMKLDPLRTKPDTEPLSDRLWRRYGRRAFDHARGDPRRPARWARTSWSSADYLRVELHTAAEHEMIVTLDDFMRRRIEDRPRRPRRRHPRLPRAARGGRDPVRRRRRAAARRVLRVARAAPPSTTRDPAAPDSDTTVGRRGPTQPVEPRSVPWRPRSSPPSEASSPSSAQHRGRPSRMPCDPPARASTRPGAVRPSRRRAARRHAAHRSADRGRAPLALDRDPCQSGRGKKRGHRCHDRSTSRSRPTTWSAPRPSTPTCSAGPTRTTGSSPAPPYWGVHTGDPAEPGSTAA